METDDDIIYSIKNNMDQLLIIIENLNIKIKDLSKIIEVQERYIHFLEEENLKFKNQD
jgi:hypothetical protein